MSYRRPSWFKNPGKPVPSPLWQPWEMLRPNSVITFMGRGNVGWSPAEIVEVLILVTGYAGFLQPQRHLGGTRDL